MKQMPCPLNGLRNISEFIYGGEVEDMPDPKKSSDKTWVEYIFYHHNTKGLVKEWWCHAATSYWFICERNTVSDEIISTYDPAKIYQEQI